MHFQFQNLIYHFWESITSCAAHLCSNSNLFIFLKLCFTVTSAHDAICYISFHQASSSTTKHRKGQHRTTTDLQKDCKGTQRTTNDLRDTADDSCDVTIQWYPPTALTGLGTNVYTVRVADRAVRRTSAPVMTLMWSTMTVPVNGATFRPDHIVFWAEHPAVPHAVIDVNDSMTTCDLNDYDRCAGGDDDVNVADNTLSMHQVSPRVMMN